jgi:hypothetical protein
MFVSRTLKEDLDTKGVTGWFVHEIFSRDYHSDGELLSWTFLPYVAGLPVARTYQERCGNAEHSQALADSAMRLSLQCFQKTHGFKTMGKELEEVLKRNSKYSTHKFFEDIRLKHSRTIMGDVIERSFWCSLHRHETYGAKPFGYSPIKQAASAAHVFSAACPILGDEDVWTEALNVLQSLN